MSSRRRTSLSIEGGGGSRQLKNYLAAARWDTLYPIYIDRKRPQQDGGRRVNAKIALEWPFAEQMAKACRMLGFEAVFEVRSLKASLVHWLWHATPRLMRVLLSACVAWGMAADEWIFRTCSL